MQIHPSHQTRLSDASSFDEICRLCGATDTRGTGTLHLPCPVGKSAPAVIGKELEGLRRRFAGSPEAYRAFAVGFVAGQAEKVALGVCPGAMFRPSPEHFGWVCDEVWVVASLLGLTVTVLDSHCPETPHEIWVHRRDRTPGDWLRSQLNSPGWHRLRAEFCGIPPGRVDTDYHLRAGYGEKCD